MDRQRLTRLKRKLQACFWHGVAHALFNLPVKIRCHLTQIGGADLIGLLMSIIYISDQPAMLMFADDIVMFWHYIQG
jgi:hypothetical protein